MSSPHQYVFYHDSIILLIYVDDTICVYCDAGAGAKLAEELCQSFDITVNGNITDFLEVVKKHSNGTYSLSQLQLIDSILHNLGLIEGKKKRTKPKRTLSKASTILRRDEDKLSHKCPWDYHSVIGKLNFLEKSTCPDISYAVHQCTRFSSNPCITHTEAIMQISMYLLSTQDKGFIMAPKDHSLDCWVDADFAGNWAKDCNPLDVDNVQSRSGYIVNYPSIPLLWHSKLQGEIALSMTKAKFYALSTSLRECIPLINLLREFIRQKFFDAQVILTVHCQMFEDNSGALKMAANS